MKWKNLLPLVIILVILVALGVYKQIRQRPVPIQQAVSLPSLLPSDLKSADLVKLELYVGAKPDEKLVLVRTDDPDKWKIPSHFDAPVSKTKIDDYLSLLTKLKGEFRATADTDDALTQYDLTDANAFHVKGYKKDAEAPAFDLLVGKAADSSTIFMRPEDKKQVFVEQSDPRREAGVFDEDTSKAPPADTWLEKKIVDLDTKKVTKIALNMPDKGLVFEQREKPQPAEEKPAADKPAADPAPSDPSDPSDLSDPSDQEAAEPKPAPEKPKEYEWVMASGGPGVAYKQPAFDSLLKAFGPLSASDVVDPAKKADWGLDAPVFKCTVTTTDPDKETIIEGGRPDPAGDGFVRLPGAPQDIVYKLTSYNFERIFPKGATLFDLPALSVDEKTVDRIEVTQPEGNIVLAKADGKWTVEEPTADLKAVETKLDTIARTLAKLKPADYADAADGTGLDAPARKVRFTAGPQTTHEFAVGGPSKSFAGSYVRMDDPAKVLAMAKTDLDKIFFPPKDLYERTLLEIKEPDISTIEVVRKDDPFILARKKEGEGWDLTAGGAALDAGKDPCDTLASAVTDLQTDDILFGKSEPAGEVFATLKVTMKDGAQHVLTFGPEADGKRELKLAGKKELFSASSIEVAEVLPTSESLKQPAPPAPEAPPAPAEGAAPAPAEGSAPAAPAEGVAPAGGAISVMPEPAPEGAPVLPVLAPAAPPAPAAPAPAPQPAAPPAPAAPPVQEAPAPAAAPAAPAPAEQSKAEKAASNS